MKQPTSSTSLELIRLRFVCVQKFYNSAYTLDEVQK